MPVIAALPQQTGSLRQPGDTVSTQRYTESDGSAGASDSSGTGPPHLSVALLDRDSTDEATTAASLC